MKLAIVTQYYPPEVGAPQVRLSELARRFVDRGHEVRVVTAMPNYPTGKVFQGYRGVLRREMREGVQILRTPIYPTQNAAMLPRLASYLSFAASAALVASPFIGRADYLLTESPPLFLGPTGWALSLLARARFIFNVSDLWPESAVRLGAVSREGRAYKAAETLEAFCYRRAWMVTGQSKSIVQSIRDRFPGVRTYHLSNGVDTARFGNAAPSTAIRTTFGGPNEFVIVYAGLHGLAQGLHQLLGAADRLRDTPVRMVFVGDGPEKRALMDAAAARALMNVTFLPPRPFAEMPTLLASADAVAVSLKTDIPGAVPSKLYEAMASGRPLVLIADGEAASVIREHDAGVVVATGDVEGLEARIRELVEDRSLRERRARNAREAVRQYYDRDTICNRFIDMLEGSAAGT